MLKTIKVNPFRLNQSGVAHLLYPILGVVVVAVIAGAGFYVYQQNSSGAGILGIGGPGKGTARYKITVVKRGTLCKNERIYCSVKNQTGKRQIFVSEEGLSNAFPAYYREGTKSGDWDSCAGKRLPESNDNTGLVEGIYIKPRGIDVTCFNRGKSYVGTNSTTFTGGGSLGYGFSAHARGQGLSATFRYYCDGSHTKICTAYDLVKVPAAQPGKEIHKSFTLAID